MIPASLAIKSPLKTAEGIKTVRQNTYRRKLVIVRINDCHKRKSIHEKACIDIERYLESNIQVYVPQNNPVPQNIHRHLTCYKSVY